MDDNYLYLLREPPGNAQLTTVDSSGASIFLDETPTISYNWTKLRLNSVYLKNATSNLIIDAIATRSYLALA